MSPINGMNAVSTKQAPECQKAVAAIIADSATAVKSAPDGKAVFSAVLPGTYYVFGMGQHQSKPALWNVRVQIKSGENSVTLERAQLTHSRTDALNTRQFWNFVSRTPVSP